ncbi:MAG: BrnA antitoxin family protein [Lachnospiraceae bacterium]|nr:BrnA antitoxin family protein [Lachnospiraceae bacterium]
MREEYDFSNAAKNPYSKAVKKQVTMNINESTVDYFKKMASESGLPYQTLINLYLDDCVKHKKKLEFV